MFNPDWMSAMGYETVAGPSARDLVKNKSVSDLIGAQVNDTVEDAIKRMAENDFSQIPIKHDERIVGSLSETHAYSCMVKKPEIRKEAVSKIMQKAFRFIDIDTPVKLLAPMITPENPALLVRDFPAGKTYILTGSDVLTAI
jgi:predicted transcriptional regulator